ncbi:MAG: PAS domain S-box protein [Smithella sp.]
MSEKDKDMSKERFSEAVETPRCNIEIIKSADKDKQTRETITSIESFYRTIFENTGTATVILEEDDTILLVDGEFEKLTGYPREEIEGRKKWTEFIHQTDDLERRHEYHHLPPVNPRSVPCTYEFQLVDKKNQIKDIVLTITPTRFLKQSLAVLLDISCLRRMEAALMESQQRPAHFIDFLPDATFAFDLSGKVIAWNRAIASICDVTDHRQDKVSLQNARDELEIRVRERTADLEKINEALQKEIFERKHAEAVRKESEEKYDQFFKTSRDCVFITSKDGKFIDLNDAAVELFGYSCREDLLQMKIPYVYANREERAKHAKVVAECGYVKEYPIDLRRRDGSVRHALITAVARYDANGKTIGFQGTIRDITEQRWAEEELRKYREELEIMVAQRTKELEDKTENLRDVNTALNVLLQKREGDRKILEESFVANLGSLVLPYVEKLRKNNLDEQQQFCLDAIEKNLGDIVTPLLKNIQQFDLTPRELQIASLIKDGKTTKEIAKTLGIVEGSIDTHRKNIRKKLGLDRSSNLQSHLRFLEK